MKQRHPPFSFNSVPSFYFIRFFRIFLIVILLYSFAWPRCNHFLFVCLEYNTDRYVCVDGEKIMLWPLLTPYFILFGLCPQCLRELFQRPSATKQ